MTDAPARRSAALGLLLVLSLLPVGLGAAVVHADPTPAAGSSRHRSPASLSVEVRGGGTTYVAGQGLVLVGDLGTRGVHAISVQSTMNRPGDRWLPLRTTSYRGRTEQDGTFRLPIRAPSMFGISYRVVGGGHATPGVTLDARTQDVALWVDGTLDYARPAQPLSLLPFTIVADTTPHFYRRPTTEGLPVLEGRRLTLLRRDGSGGWEVVARTVADEEGLGHFPGLTEPPGDHVYRVREERWDEEGSEVGWMWSWPLSVHVRSVLELVSWVPEGPPTTGNVAGQADPERAHPTAAARYRWGAARWDYAWELGESLDDAPSLGTERSGRWSEVGTGLGRVVKHNGGLLVSSGQLVRDGRGDVGTTRAVLGGAAAAHGLWEALMSLATAEERSTDYDAVLELVPVTGADQPCAPSITIARWTGLGTAMTVGAANRGREWSRTIATEGVGHDIPAVAVEVAARHVTWFLDSRPVGTVRSARAVPGVPLTLRLGLEGDDGEHDNSSLFSDWQRSYTLEPGTQVATGPALRASTRRGC